MSSLPDTIVNVGLRLLPAPMRRKLQTEAGKRFTRFLLVALVAVITSQVVLGLLTGPIDLNSAGAAGVIASMIAALVSYLLSRWAWERKGRPDLLRETVPFWLVSAAVWAILGLTSHYASVFAHTEGYTHFKKHLVVQGAYFLMNCITFVARFVFFHYVLFAKRASPDSASASSSPSATSATSAGPDAAGAVDQPALASAEAARGTDTGPMALAAGDSGPPRS